MQKYTPLKKTHLVRHKLHVLSTNEYVKILVLRTLGNFLIFSSLFMIGKTFYQPVKEELRFFVNTQFDKQFVAADSPQARSQLQTPQQPKGGLARLLSIRPVEILVPEDPDFSIVIPKIGANARILADVDASSQTDYLEALQKGVAHAAGTAFPGEGGHIFLFAHSTDYIWNVGTYNAVFYLLYKLEIGNEINLYYHGHRFVYKVTDSKVVDPSEVEYITRKTERESLTLQTCWPPGTTLKRLLVFATRVVE